MTSIEIERHESPYTNTDLQFPVLAPPPCGGGCSCCCCCCSSSFVIPEAFILNAVSEKNKLSRKELFRKYLLIYGLSFVLYTTIIAVVYFLVPVPNLIAGLCIFGIVGALVINPVVVGILSSNAKQYDTDSKARPLGFYVFLIGLLLVGLFLLGVVGFL